MRLYDETCLALCEGQYIDIATSESDWVMSVDAYFDMIGRKTAALIAASIEAGALLATDDEQVIGRYRAFGWALGIAFQLNDDLLGIWGATQATGKQASDVAHKKKTLPVIYAVEHAGPEDRERLLELYALEEPSPEQLDEIVRILERVGARDYTRDTALRYRDQALAALDRGETDAGENLLLKARELYDHSLDPSLWGKEGGQNRAVPFNNLGAVWLQIAQVKAVSRADVQQEVRVVSGGADEVVDELFRALESLVRGVESPGAVDGVAGLEGE